MKTYYKIILPGFIAAALMIGVPYIKTPCDCGLNLPIAFTGAILGCGGEDKTGSTENTADSSTTAASEKQSAGDTGDARNTELKVTFVELGSVNCVPCRMMQPVMEQVETKYPGQVKVIFHDVWTDKGRAEGSRFGIRVIPTQVFLDKDGKEYFRHEGFFSFEEIEKILKRKGVK